MQSELTEFVKVLRLQIAASTLRRKEWELRAFGRWLEKKKRRVIDTTQSDVEQFLLSLDAANQFRRSVCATIRNLFEYLQTSENPAAGIQFKRDESVRLFRVPGKVDIDELLGRLAKEGSDLRIRDRLMVELAYGSGLRRDELRKINIEDLDLEGQTVHVTGKGNKTRIVPVTSQAVSTARTYLTQRHATRGPLLVSFMGRRLSPGGIYTILRSRAGIRPHLLRHACAGHMLANGASIRVVQELLGHADLKATQIYTQVEKKQLREVITARHPRAQPGEPDQGR